MEVGLVGDREEHRGLEVKAKSVNPEPCMKVVDHKFEAADYLNPNTSVGFESMGS